MRKLKSIVTTDLRKYSFYSVIALSSIVLISYQNCGKVKFNTAPKNAAAAVPLSCGSISMTPVNGLYSNTDITFQADLPTGTTTSNFEWTFEKDSTVLFNSTTNPIVHSFDDSTEGPGNYTATASFLKSDGNTCELAQSFQILANDLCASPSGISGPTIGYVGEETSPFSVDFEACFFGSVAWDMDNDGIVEYNVSVSDSITHIYTAIGTYTVVATVIDQDTGNIISLSSTIEIRNKSCPHPFDPSQSVPHGQSLEFAKPNAECGNKPCLKQNRTCENGSFTGDATFDQNPATCSATNCSSCKVKYPNDTATYTIALNTSVTRYSKTASCSSSCQSETFNCTQAVANAGTLFTFPNGFTYTSSSSCNADNICSNNNCTLDGVTVNHGQSRNFFNSDTVACGKSCQSQSRTCNNGTLSGNSSYNQATCSVNSCSYTWQIGSWSSCSATACGTNGTQERSVVCKRSDGTTVADSNCTGTKPKTSQTCSAPACKSCGSTPHGASVTKWKKGSTCETSCTSQTRTCNNGSMPAFSAGYTYSSKTSCPITACPNYDWKVGDWGYCKISQPRQPTPESCTLLRICEDLPGYGTQSRTVVCKNTDTDATVADSNCPDPKPAMSKGCRGYNGGCYHRCDLLRTSPLNGYYWCNGGCCGLQTPSLRCP